MPATVEKVILARVDRLTAECREALTAASVLGRNFTLSLLAGVAGGEEKLREPLRELQRLDLLRQSRRWPQPEFRFKHILIQEAVYRTIVGSERRRLHREAAVWLEAAPTPPTTRLRCSRTTGSPPRTRTRRSTT